MEIFVFNDSRFLCLARSDLIEKNYINLLSVFSKVNEDEILV